MKKEKTKSAPSPLYNTLHPVTDEITCLCQPRQERSTKVSRDNHLQVRRKKKKKKKRHERKSHDDNTPMLMEGAKMRTVEPDNGHNMNMQHSLQNMKPDSTENVKLENNRINRLMTTREQIPCDKRCKVKENRTDSANTSTVDDAIDLLQIEVKGNKRSGRDSGNTTVVEEDKDERKNQKKEHKEMRSNIVPMSSSRSIWKDGMGVPNDINNLDEVISLDEGKDSDRMKTTTEEGGDWFRALHYINSTTRDQKKLEMLKTIGIVPKKGKWAADEVQQLKNNMKEFLTSNKVSDPSRLIITRTKEDRAFLKNTQFLVNMCRGIRRTRKSVGMKIVTEFSPDFYHKGKFSDTEKGELIRLHKSGTRWIDIGLILNRSHYNMWNTCYRSSKAWKRGKWDYDEDRALIIAVKKYVRKEKNVNWMDVSDMVGTRTALACLSRWRSNSIQYKLNDDRLLARKDSFISISNHNFTPGDACKLVSLLYESHAEDEAFIDWVEISTKFSENITPDFLRWKFGALRTQVSNYHILEFGELIDKLYKIYENKQ